MSSTKSHNKTQITLFIFLALYFSIFTAHAAVFTSSQNGNWNVSATWGGAGVPGASDEVVISAGDTVTLVANTSITGAATINGQLAMATFNFTCGSLSGSGNVASSGSPVFTTGALNTNTIFSGTLGTGSFSLVKNGTGSLTLSGSNTFTGGITLNSTALLNISHSNALGTGALTLAGTGCRIDNTSGADLTLATINQVNVNNNFTFIGTHNLTFGTGNVVFNASRIITLTSNTLRFNGQGQGNVTSNYTITVNGPGNTIEFNGFAIVTTGAAARSLTFNGTGNVVINAAVTNGTVAGCPFVYSGTGTLELLAAATYTGATTITSGTCILGATNGLSTSSAITVNGTLDVNGFSQTFANLTGTTGTITTSMVGSFTLTLTNSSNGTYNGVIDEGSATFEIIKTGTATLTLGGANTYSGLTTVSAGTIIVTNSSALGNTIGATTVASGAVLSVSGGITLADNITLAGTGISNGGALINALGVNTVTGDITYTTASRITSTAGTLTLGNLSATNLAMVLIGAGGIVIDGVVNIGNASLTLSASAGSSLTLNSANTINNGLVLAANSRLNIGHAGALGTGAITLLGTIDNARIEPLTLTTNNAFTVTTGFTFAGSNNLNLGTGAVTLSGNQTIIVNGSSSILTFGGTATNSFAGNINVTANGAGNTLAFTNFNISNSAATRTVTFQGTGIISVDGIIANGGTATAGNIIKAGTGILELRGANSYQGNLTINTGIVRSFSNNAFGDLANFSTVIVASGASLEVNNHNFVSTKSLTLNGNGVNDSGALRIMSGTCLINAVNLLSASRIQVESGATYSANSNISGAFPLTLHIDGSMSLTPIGGSIITGSTVLKSGTGTLSYSAVQTHTDITLANGRFELDIANAIAATAGISVNSPGIVDMNGRNQSVRFIAGNGTITNEGLAATATLTLNNTTGETHDFSGTLLQGTATRINLTKTAGGTQILSGNNTYNGLTTINNGALRASHNNALGVVNAGTTVNSGGALELAGNITISDTLTVSGAGPSSGGAIRNMSGDNTIVPPVTSGANSRINSDAGTLIFASTATYNAATRNITFGGAGNITYSAPINITTGALTKDGAGTLILGGDNSYTGATSISAGIIRLEHVRGIPPLSALTVGTSATFDINGFSPIIGSLASSATSAIINSSSPGDLLLTIGANNTTTSYSGTIQNGSATSISLRKIGTGTLTIFNAGSNYSGTTVISNGNLSLTGNVTATGNSPIGTNTAGVILGDTGTTAINASPTLGMDNNLTYARNITVADQATTGTYTIRAAGGSPTITGQIILNQPITIIPQTSRTIALNGGITSANAGEKRVTFDVQGTLNVGTGLITDGSGKLNILKTGAGTLTLNSALHTFSGTVTINAGTLRANDIANAGFASSIGTGSPADTIYINGGATFAIGTTVNDATNRTLAITGNGATISTGANNVTYTLNGSIVGNFSSIFSYNTSTIAMGGVVSCGAITKAGSGILRLDNTSNNYTGSTTVSAGILRLGASGVIPDGSALINNATFELNGFNETLGSIAGTGGLIRNQSAATVSTLTCGGDNTSTTYSGIIQNGSTQTLNLVKEGSGTLTLDNLNTYTGTTTINGGVLKAGGMSVFGSNSAFTLADVAGVAIDITAFDQTIGSLAGGGATGGNVLLGAAVLTTGGNNSSTTFFGIISGTGGGLTKVGTGVLTLNGVNTYTGLTTVSAGTLRAGVALNSPGGLSLATGGLFDCNNVTSTAGFLLLNGAGQNPNTFGSTASAATVQNNTFFTAASTGILDVTGGLSAGYWTGATSTDWHTASNWQGNTVPDATTDVFIQSAPANQPVIGATALARKITIFTGASLTISGTNRLTVSRDWNNQGTFTPNSSTVVFDAATLQDAYNGSNTFFNIEHSGSGTLEILTNNVNPFTVTNELLQSGGGIIDLNSKNLNVGSLVGNGTIRTSAAERDTLTISGSITASGDYSGIIENGVGTLSVIRSGTGIVAFSGNNSFTGSLRISGGTLVAAHANALGLDTVFFSGGTLRCRSNSDLIFNRPCIATANTTINIDRETAGSGVTYTFGTLRINSTATLTLSGGNNVNAGTAGVTFGNMAFAAAPTFTVNNPSLGGNTLFTFGAVSGTFGATYNGNGDAIQTGRYEIAGGGINYSGTGNLFLNRQNTFTGVLNISSGNVVGSDSTQAFGAGSITMTGGRLTLVNDANIAFGRNVTYNGNVEIMLDRTTPGPSRTFNMGNLTCTSGNLTLLNGTNNTSGTPIVVFNTTTLNAATIFDVATDARLQMTVLNGNNSMTKNGNGELRITGSSTTRNGSLAPNILNAGRLALLNATALANADTANLTMNGGILDLMADATIDFNVRPIINSNTEIQVNRVAAGGALTHTVRALTIGNATLTVANGSNISAGISTLTVNGLFNLTGDATIITSANLQLNGAAAGTGNFTKDGPFSLSQNFLSGFTFPGSLTINGGTLSTFSNSFGVTGLTTANVGSFNLNGTSHALAGGLTVSGGTLSSANSSTTTITGNFTQTAGTVSFGTGCVINLSGNFIRNGGTYAANGTLHMNGTTQEISGTINPITIRNFIVESGSTTTLAQNIRITSGDLTISSGATLNANTFTLNRSTGGGQLLIAGTLRLSGNTGGITGSNFPSSFATFPGSTGTVVYERATGEQTIHSGYTYFNLVTGNTSGTQTVGGNITINGTLTTTAGGTLNMGTSQLLGTFTTATHNGTLRTQNTSTLPFPTGVDFTNAGATGTIIFDGTANQAIPANTTCFNMTLSNGNQTNLQGNATVNGTLSFVSGTCNLNGQFLSVNNLSGHSVTNEFISSPSASLTLRGTVGNLFFNQSIQGQTNAIRNLTFEASVSATLMNPIFIVAGLASGTLVVGTSASLQTSNNLTLLSDANGSARIGTSEGTITGNATVQRCIPAFPSPGPTNSFGRRWRFVSSPIQNATFLDWRNEVFITGPGTGNTVGTFNSNGFDATMNNNPSLFRYNEFVTDHRDSGWVSIKHIDSTIVPGIGYRLFVRGDRSDTSRIGLQSASTPQNQVTLNLIGPVNQGNVTIPISFTSSGNIDEDGWNLLGNPYPSPINWDVIHDAGRIPAGAGFTGTNYNNLEANIWVFNPITANYDTYNALSNLGNISGGIVASGQSFWVKATDISPGLLCREVHKTAGGNGLFKTEPEQFHITLIYDSTNQDKLIVGYIDGSTPDYDAYDAADIVTPLSVSAYGKDKKKLAISSRPQVTDKDTIWLSVNAYRNTENKLVFNNMNTGRLLVLVDTYTGTSAPISEGFVYTFQVTDDAATRGDKRFYIVSEFSTTSVDDPSLLNPVSDDIQLYPNPADNRFYIKHTSNKDIQSVVIRNTEGKEVWKSSAEFVFKNGIDITDLTDGIYWVETTINQQSFYTKLVIIH